MFPNPTSRATASRYRFRRGEQDGVLDVATLVTKPVRTRVAATASGRTRVVPSVFRCRGSRCERSSGAGRRSALRSAGRMTASVERAFSPRTSTIRNLTGDRNPIFRDDAAARARGFAGAPCPARYSPHVLRFARHESRTRHRVDEADAALPAPAYRGSAARERRHHEAPREKELVNLATRVTAADGRVVCDVRRWCWYEI